MVQNQSCLSETMPRSEEGAMEARKEGRRSAVKRLTGTITIAMKRLPELARMKFRHCASAPGENPADSN